jgi:hypothetical protein
MTTITDLERCVAVPKATDDILAVGWLGKERNYGQGETSSAFFAKLKALCADPWQPFVFAGGHQCELCQFDPPSFGANLFVPHGGRIYVAPVGIVHYVASHWYAPPTQFIEAVLSCPATRSMEYKKLFLANGGGVFLRGLA